MSYTPSISIYMPGVSLYMLGVSFCMLGVSFCMLGVYMSGVWLYAELVQFHVRLKSEQRSCRVRQLLCVGKDRIFVLILVKNQFSIFLM